MNTTANGRTFSSAAFTTAAFLAATTMPAQNVVPALYFPAASVKENYASFSAGSVSVDGNAGAFQHRRQADESFFGGIDGFRHRSYLDNNVIQTIEGRILAGSNEFMLKGHWEFSDSGSYIEAGYKESRVFYNGSGGTVSSGEWFPIIDPRLATDRSTIWVEGAWVKDANTARLRISHTERDGTKDSTAWGDANTGVGLRYIVPAFWTIDETRTSIAADFEHAGETATLGGGVRVEDFETNNSRNIRRRPGESADRFVTQRDQSDSDLFAAHAYTVSQHGEKLTLSTAASYTTIDTNLMGRRVVGAAYDSLFDPSFVRQNFDEGFIGLTGDSNWNQFVITANSLYLPDTGWRVNAGLRYENQSQDVISEFLETNFRFGTALEHDLEGSSDRDFDEALGNFEVTYTGTPNWVITAFVQSSMGDGTLDEELREPDIDVIDIERSTRFDRDSTKYGLDARWYPSSDLNFAAGAYHKVRDNDYMTDQDSTPPTGGDRFPAFITRQKFSTDDLYVRSTWRPGAGVAITSRYDYQQTDIESQEEGLAGVLSGDMTTHIVAATVTVTPITNVMVQAGTHWIYDEVNTGLTGPAAQIVPGFDNNYRIHSLMVLVALNEQTDITGEYRYYSANNFDDISEFTVPFGVSQRDEDFGVSINHRVNEDLALSLRVSHGEFEDFTSGGNNDFDYDMIYGRVQLRY